MSQPEINIKGIHGEKDNIGNHFSIIGRAIDENGNDVKYLIKENIKIIDNIQKLFLNNKLNGFFSVVYSTIDNIIIISDRVRSKPIYYSVNNNISVSDDIYHVIETSGNATINSISREEFLKTGYVTGNQTIFDNVFQTESSQIVTINKKSREIKKHNYWHFTPTTNSNHGTSNEIIDDLDAVMMRCIRRMDKASQGKRFVIPLSGGYDSRAIATYLRKADYENVLTFTFGPSGSPEVITSKKVAEALGYKWLHIEYTSETWKSLRRSEVFNKYIEFIGSGTSVPNILVFPALLQLYNSGTISSEDIFVPGHTADFVSGGHFTKSDLNLNNDRSYFINNILNRHYKRNKIPVSNDLYKKILQNIESLEDDTGYKMNLPLCEAWECRERQSKFIVNSNRYYDFFSLSWWMPFWDNEFVEFWANTDYTQRLNKRLWIEFVNKKFEEVTGCPAIEGKIKISTSPLGKRIKSNLDYFYDINRVLCIMPFSRWFLYKTRLSKKSGKLFGYLSDLYLERLEKHIEYLNR